MGVLQKIFFSTASPPEAAIWRCGEAAKRRKYDDEGAGRIYDKTLLPARQAGQGSLRCRTALAVGGSLALRTLTGRLLFGTNLVRFGFTVWMTGFLATAGLTAGFNGWAIGSGAGVVDHKRQ